MSVLIVVAHPDDEVLGCGGAAAALAAAGVPVTSCILSGMVDVRQHRPTTPELLEDTLRAQRILGLREPILGDFPNIRFNTVPHVEMVRFIEEAIVRTGATTLFTHHPDDLNDDHLHVSRACQAASRLYQRRSGVAPLQALYYVEVPSSTDWAYPREGTGFRPDTFVELGEELVARKIEALAAYRGVMRPFPHPRSDEILRGLAALRGGQSGARYAEAFQTAFRRLEPSHFGAGTGTGTADIG